MKKFITALAALSMMASPAMAQDSLRMAAYGPDHSGSYQKPTMFTGATLRLRAGGHGAPKPEFALRVTGGIRNGETNDLRLGEGVSLKFSDSKPKLQMAGQDVDKMGPRLGMSKGTTVAVVVGALALVGAAFLIGMNDFADDLEAED